MTRFVNVMCRDGGKITSLWLNPAHIVSVFALNPFTTIVTMAGGSIIETGDEVHTILARIAGHRNA